MTEQIIADAAFKIGHVAVWAIWCGAIIEAWYERALLDVQLILANDLGRIEFMRERAKG